MSQRAAYLIVAVHEVQVRTTKEEKYGRMLADCYRAGEPSLCTELLERGLARPYNP